MRVREYVSIVHNIISIDVEYYYNSVQYSTAS